MIRRPETQDTRPCRGVDRELIFGPADSRRADRCWAGSWAALAVCHRCPVVEACLQAALKLLFIAINYLLGRFAQWVERRLSRAVPAGGTKPAVFTDESAALASTDRNGR